MKKIVICLFAFCITLSGCRSEISKFSLFGPVATETPIPTPTLTPEKKFCENYTKSQTEMDKFVQANEEFLEFLGTENYQGLQWSQLLTIALMIGPVAVDDIKKDYPNEYQQFVDKTGSMMNSGVDLQIVLHREIIPQQLEFSIQKISDCIEDTIAFSKSLNEFFTVGTQFDGSLSLDACSSISAYYKEITNFCSSQ